MSCPPSLTNYPELRFHKPADDHLLKQLLTISLLLRPEQSLERVSAQRRGDTHGGFFHRKQAFPIKELPINAHCAHAPLSRNTFREEEGRGA